MAKLDDYLWENYSLDYEVGSKRSQCPMCSEPFFYVNNDETYGSCFGSNCRFTVNVDGKGRVSEVDGDLSDVRAPPFSVSCLKNTFYQLPKTWLLSDISPNAYRLAMFYWVHSNHEKLFSYYGRDRICRMLKISLSTFKKVRRELEEAKVIGTVHWRGHRTSRVYINPKFAEGLNTARQTAKGKAPKGGTSPPVTGALDRP